MSTKKTRRTSQLPEKLNLLIVDSEAPRLFPKESELHEIFSMFVTTTLERATAIVKQNDIHIAFCEEDLPDGKGSEFLIKLKQQHPDIIRILSAEKESKTDMMEIINEANIFKFIVRPWGFELRNILEEAKQFYLSRIQNEYTDNLTRLRSTAAIFDILHSELTRAARHKLTFSAVLMNITSPNQNSDLHAFLVDRFVLRKIADILWEELRESDSAGRLKDNKILVLLTEADNDGAEIFLQRFRKSVKKFDREVNRGLLPFEINTAVETVTGEKIVTENDLIATLYHKLFGVV